MKPTILVTLASANLISAVQFINGPTGWPEALKFNTRSQPWADATIDKRAVAPPKIQELPNRNPHIPGAKTIKIRYGPYTIPGAKVPGGEGMIVNRPTPSIDKPCQQCTILGMNAGLEYPDGKDANTDTLLWLHHMVMFNIGKDAWDATCTIFGAPHLIVGSMSQSSERIFSSGNERTTTFFNPPWANVTNLGYALFPADRFGLIVDLMNMNMEAKPAYLTIYYDFVEGHPTHFEHVKPVWLDAAQCGTSEISGRAPGAKFDFASPAWISNFEGEVMGAGGHLHDGGTKLDIIVDKKIICSSVPTYGTDEEALVRADAAKKGNIAKLNAPGASPAAVPKTQAKTQKRSPQGKAGKGARGKAGTAAAPPPTPKQGGGTEGGHSHMGGKHIIAMSICADNKAKISSMPISPLGITKLSKGQNWTLRAYYDYSQFPGMKNVRGQMTTVMGISIMYAKTAVKRKG